MQKIDDPYGDGGGARIGEPTTPQRNNRGLGSLGSSKESSGGIAREGSGNVNEDRSATAPARAARARKALEDHAPGHESGYGGKKGEPKTSSDQR
jgi:hypothetical protein